MRFYQSSTPEKQSNTLFDGIPTYKFGMEMDLNLQSVLTYEMVQVIKDRVIGAERTITYFQSLLLKQMLRETSVIQTTHKDVVCNKWNTDLCYLPNCPESQLLRAHKE